MDQLIFASLSHTHYWYEVGMLKVPAAERDQRNIYQAPMRAKEKHKQTKNDNEKGA